MVVVLFVICLECHCLLKSYLVPIFASLSTETLQQSFLYRYQIHEILQSFHSRYGDRVLIDSHIVQTLHKFNDLFDRNNICMSTQGTKKTF